MRQFKVGTILVVGFGVYGSLASIFPNAFSSSADKAALIGWLWNQSLVWLSIPIAVAWFGWMAYTIMERLDALKEDYGNLWNRINANNDNLQRSINETAKSRFVLLLSSGLTPLRPENWRRLIDAWDD